MLTFLNSIWKRVFDYVESETANRPAQRRQIRRRQIRRRRSANFEVETAQEEEASLGTSGIVPFFAVPRTLTIHAPNRCSPAWLRKRADFLRVLIILDGPAQHAKTFDGSLIIRASSAQTVRSAMPAWSKFDRSLDRSSDQSLCSLRSRIEGDHCQ